MSVQDIRIRAFLVSPTHHLKPRIDTGLQGKVEKTHESFGRVTGRKGPVRTDLPA